LRPVSIPPIQLPSHVSTKRPSPRPGGTFAQLLTKELESTSPAALNPEGVVQYTVQPGDTLWKIGTEFRGDPYRIAKDNGIANPDRIYPGQKLSIRKSNPTSPQLVTASWYGKEYQNRKTANGETFDMFQDTLAHKSLPFGTVVRLTNPDNGTVAVGRVNDRGPFIKGRDIDLSYSLARRMGLVDKGIGRLIMQIL
jgi:rare lipoprotein A